MDAASGTKSGTLKFVRTLTNISKDAGGVAHMRCEVVGDPPPTKIRWYKNEAPLEENRPKITIRKIHAQVSIIELLLICNRFSRALRTRDFVIFRLFNFRFLYLKKLKFLVFYCTFYIPFILDCNVNKFDYFQYFFYLLTKYRMWCF